MEEEIISNSEALSLITTKPPYMFRPIGAVAGWNSIRNDFEYGPSILFPEDKPVELKGTFPLSNDYMKQYGKNKLLTHTLGDKIVRIVGSDPNCEHTRLRGSDFINKYGSIVRTNCKINVVEVKPRGGSRRRRNKKRSARRRSASRRSTRRR
jgi:hypothetical protein